MCGLAGWYGLDLQDKDKQTELFRLLMRKAQVRGVDSFGVTFAQSRTTKIHRGLGPVSKWLTESGKRIRKVAASRVILGHTRAASRGDVTLGNAHPFRVGDWVGAHNGCLQNSGDLMVEARYAPRGETDSEEALAWLVSEGLTTEAFAELRGWYALTVLKNDASELVIAVDGRTPFAIARIGEAVVWHSLAAALDASLRAVGIDAQVEEVKNQILRFPTGDVIQTAPPTPVESHMPITPPHDVTFLDTLEREDQFALDFGGEGGWA
jgi:glucosamine 6-phosphate synthetase-like amidotransferase/phosphosugar isomerase protein